VPGDAERGVLVIEGELAIDDDVLVRDQLAVLQPGAVAVARARGLARVLVVGGPRLDGERHLDWNFVSSSKDKIAAARDAWTARAFPTIPGDDVEWIPYPTHEPHPKPTTQEPM
jgi:redox-sensitive bicupin YhaK (pirin superfamily)